MKKLTCKLIGNKIISPIGETHIKTDNSKVVKKHFALNSFMWIDEKNCFKNGDCKKKLNRLELFMILLQPKIDYFQNFLNTFVFDDNFVIKVRTAKMGYKTAYIAEINGMSIFITKRMYYLFPFKSFYKNKI